MVRNKKPSPSAGKAAERPKTRQRKAVLSKQSRRVCALAGCVILLLSAASLAVWLRPAKENTEQTLYSYQVSAGASYGVHLISNSLYEGQWLEEGRVYPEALTDYVQIRLQAAFQGSGPAAVSGSYQVGAVLQGYQTASEGRQVVYEKQFPLKKGEIPGTDSGQAAVDETVPIYLAPYRQFAGQAEQILHTSVARVLVVSFTGGFTADTEFGRRQQDFAYQITLPVGTGTTLFEITKPDSVHKEGTITQSRESTKPVSAGKVTLSSLGCAAGILTMLFTLLFTRLPNEEEAWRAEMKRILRKYGSRMTKLEHLPGPEQQERVYVADIDSMVAMAEELRRPLFYCPGPEQLPRDGVFCLPDGERLYLFQLKRPDTPLVVGAGAEGGG